MTDSSAADALPSTDVSLPFPALLTSPDGKTLLCIQLYRRGFTWREDRIEDDFIRLVIVDASRMVEICRRDLPTADSAFGLGNESLFVFDPQQNMVQSLSLADLSVVRSRSMPAADLFPPEHRAQLEAAPVKPQRIDMAVPGNEFIVIQTQWAFPGGAVGQVRLHPETLEDSREWGSVSSGPEDIPVRLPVVGAGDGWIIDGVLYDATLKQPRLLLVPQPTTLALPRFLELVSGSLPDLQSVNRRVEMFPIPAQRAVGLFAFPGSEFHDSLRKGIETQVSLAISDHDSWDSLATVALGRFNLGEVFHSDAATEMERAINRFHFEKKGSAMQIDAVPFSLTLGRGRVFASLNGRVYRWDLPAPVMTPAGGMKRIQPQQSRFLVDYGESFTLTHEVPGNLKLNQLQTSQGESLRLEHGKWDIRFDDEFWTKTSFAPESISAMPPHVRHLPGYRQGDRVVPVSVNVQSTNPSDWMTYFILVRVNSEAEARIAVTHTRESLNRQAAESRARTRKVEADSTAFMSREERQQRASWTILLTGLLGGVLTLATMVGLSRFLAVRE